MLRTLSLSLLLILAISQSGCRNTNPVSPEDQKKIIFAEFMQEVNSFSPVLTTRRNFMADHLFFGEDVLESGRKENKQLAGFLKAIDRAGGQIRAVPVAHAKSMSGGPVEFEFYEEIKNLIIEGIASAGQVDGVYLSLHGAMGVDGIFDPEGEIIEAVRDLVGPDVPVAASFDLHANMTRRRVENADILVGYRTNPHRDHFSTGYRTGELLVRTISGEIEPVIAMNKLPLIKGGGINIDFLSPFRKIFRRMKRMERQDDVLSVSFFPVHLWIDEPEMGYTTIAITDGKAELAGQLADEIADMAWDVRDVPQPEVKTPSEAIEIARKKRLARKLGTVVFCDVSDAVGTGTPGENTWILDALLDDGCDLTSYLTIRDEEAAQEAWNYNVGERVNLTVGGKLDTIYNRPVDYSGEITFREETTYGKTVIVRHNGIHLIIAELPIASRTTSDFRDLGLSLWKADIVVVKNLFPFRYNYLLQNRKTVNVMTPGISNTDPFSLKFENIPRPVYPLDDIDSWRL